MTRRYREAEMSPVVSHWLIDLGYSVYSEVPLFGSASAIDHVGIRWTDESIICVEMKCSFTAKVLYQAYLRQLATPLVYIAVPNSPRQSSLDKAARAGLGVLAGGVVILKPTCERTTYDSYSRVILEHCRHSKEGGIGGMPTIAGDGPAIRVSTAVNAYLAEHPNASWKQIFAEVPNHYAHARSMAGALPFASARARRAAGSGMAIP